VHAVLEDLNFIGLSNERVKADTDLALACCTYLVVMHFNV